MKNFKVIDSRQEAHPFSKKKIYNSCINCGASDKIANEVAKKVKESFRSKTITTNEISKLVKKSLAKKSKKSSIKFSLKEAMRKLGPTGFDFEKYISSIFQENGFTTKTNQMVPGKCISSYEIDLLAKRDNFKYVGECKYHTFPGKRVDLKVALYNNARFLDIKEKEKPDKLDLRAILITNTKFTGKAIDYSKCSGVDLLGWKYPINNGLETIIDKSGLYPITILPSFRNSFKDVFAQARIMLARDLIEMSSDQISIKTRIPIKNIDKLVEEAKILLE